MNEPFHDALAAGLPGGRDDEPASLRQDILDELNDHLVCALNRERMRSGMARPGTEISSDETSSTAHAAVWQRVEQRFGDPRALARRLWFDAMWSRIMNQRFLMAAVCLLVAISLGSLTLAWQTLAASRELAAQAQAGNAELLKELRTLIGKTSAAPAIPQQPREWNRFKIRCVAEKQAGKPLPGIAVTLAGAETPLRLPAKTITTDAQGMADFGLVAYGQYNVEIVAGELRRQHKVAVFPGEDFEETLPCPNPGTHAKVNLQVKLPDIALPDAVKSKLWYGISIWPDAVAAELWSPVKRDIEAGLSFYVSPDGKLWPAKVATRETYESTETYEPPRFNGLQKKIETVPRPTDTPFAKYASTRITLPATALPLDQLALPLGSYKVRFNHVLVADDRDPRAYFTLPASLLSSFLSDEIYRLDIRNQGLVAGDTATEPMSVSATWPVNASWVIPVPSPNLDAIRFLTEIPAESRPIALISTRVLGTWHPPAAVTDRVDLYFDQQLILEGVPVMLREFQANQNSPIIRGAQHRIELLLCYLTDQETAMILPHQFRQNPMQPAITRLTFKIRPGKPDEARGSLVSDFEERIKGKKPAAKPPGTN